MILPVDQSARALPRQRFLLLDQLRTTLASVLQASIPRKNLKKTEWRRCGLSRSDAQVSDGINKYCTALVDGCDDVASCYSIGVLTRRQVGRCEGSREARVVADC